ncbi:hypothetical protein NEPAR06_1610 [Nematocida parisii]|uniref:Uncharacterized protein n=1 Tax=Nematocida parisii (strain ERTm3) TaxID=935791 RepID=I3EJA0_NEMP3|nr:uncharacterized protein NEPG_02534 [Nematocida parisii ERTm1]EIJ89297.1 hypothetical protein NEQG_00067 [Nematocida parisii ERTm3]KAI5125664.1 hypothetical protein NEPAR03_0192 [Nematocida parisii]EIJ92646.1 hypothetical protein NEPG_02534 [Nematocida parisii ERTm1]KAI5125714.1 hypothetical protein NEPAR08_0152 [Nematocida parisii]KAI5140253.1 hypothetical protein NEPAR04_0198 [Nematocida parisii]|eukprot:XP_013060361.1 hypothetical protein NEPG_02534 [Nematocida parisii ERTm1]
MHKIRKKRQIIFGILHILLIAMKKASTQGMPYAEIIKIHEIEIMCQNSIRIAISLKGALNLLYPYFIEEKLIMKEYYENLKSKENQENSLGGLHTPKKSINILPNIVKKFMPIKKKKRLILEEYYNMCNAAFLDMFIFENTSVPNIVNSNCDKPSSAHVENTVIVINKRKKYSFSNFLAEEKVEKYSNYILASLFLLSEGIKVPIKICSCKKKQEIILILTNYQKTKPIFHIEIDRTLNKYLPDVSRIFRLFKKYTKICKLLKPEQRKEPSTFDEFKANEFLGSLRFLIRMYIYKFYTNCDELKLFYIEVDRILSDIVINTMTLTIPMDSFAINQCADSLFTELFEFTLDGFYKSEKEFEKIYKKVYEEVNNEVKV